MRPRLLYADCSHVEPLRPREELTRIDLEVVLSLRWSTALAATLAAACITVAPAHSGVSCGPSGYAYAGIQPGQSGYGVSVRLASLAAPVVQSGHVAGWVGVGGPGQGPGGSNEWIQVGLNSLPGTTNKLYYEVMQPGLGQTYAEVATDVPNGRSLRLAVLETAATPGAWRVWVNGRPVTPAIMLPGSHGALSPMAMGESWDGGRPSCNRYAYRFDKVSVAAAPGGSWLPARDATVLQDPGTRWSSAPWLPSTPARWRPSPPLRRRPFRSSLGRRPPPGMRRRPRRAGPLRPPGRRGPRRQRHLGRLAAPQGLPPLADDRGDPRR